MGAQKGRAPLPRGAGTTITSSRTRSKNTTSSRRSWPEILEQAEAIVESYATAVTLRQLFYRLVAAGIIPNTSSAYKTLSARTAEARREGWFPALEDHTRTIWRPFSFPSVEDATSWLASQYRRDRTEGQEFNVYLGVEKATLTAQLESWFELYGVPILALRGYSSQTLADDVAENVMLDGRPAVLIYGGDHDATGEDVLRDFVERTEGAFDEVVHVALTAEQVEKYGLPSQPGKATDSRAAGFVARHGELVQVELEALDPETLRQLYTDALDDFFDTSTWERIVEQEEAERAELAGGAR